MPAPPRPAWPRPRRRRRPTPQLGATRRAAPRTFGDAAAASGRGSGPGGQHGGRGAQGGEVRGGIPQAVGVRPGRLVQTVPGQREQLHGVGGASRVRGTVGAESPGGAPRRPRGRAKGVYRHRLLLRYVWTLATAAQSTSRSPLRRKSQRVPPSAHGMTASNRAGRALPTPAGRFARRKHRTGGGSVARHPGVGTGGGQRGHLRIRSEIRPVGDGAANVIPSCRTEVRTRVSEYPTPPPTSSQCRHQVGSVRLVIPDVWPAMSAS
jgi:hypothetical protein